MLRSGLKAVAGKAGAWLLAAAILLGLLAGCGENTPTPVLSGITVTPAVIASAPAGTQAGLPNQATLPTASATITRADGTNLALVVELARTEQEQETGMMGRTNLPDDRGMLFVYTKPVSLGFWMRNTPSALSIAFIDENGKIIDIQEMAPLSDDVHASPRSYLLALEMPSGYFARKGVKPGDTFRLK